MDYSVKHSELCNLLRSTGNVNILRDFFTQLQIHRTLNETHIGNQLDGLPLEEPKWLPLVTKTDVRNIVVFLMWKEFSTVIDAHQSMFNEDSSLGIHVEDLAVHVETMYYVKQIENLQNGAYETKVLSYTEWVRSMVDSIGLVKTIGVLMP